MKVAMPFNWKLKFSRLGFRDLTMPCKHRALCAIERIC